MSAHKFASRFEQDPSGRVCVVVLSGSLDPLASEELGPKLQDLHRTGCRKFVIDLTELGYVGSLGIRLLVSLSNQVKGEGAVALCNPTREVRMIIEMTHLDKVVKVFPTRAEAIGAVRDA